MLPPVPMLLPLSMSFGHSGATPSADQNLSATDYIVGYAPGADTPTQTVSGTVAAGTGLPLRYTGASSNVDIVVAPGQVVATSLEVASPIRNAQNQVIIPAGSTVQGRIEPVEIRGSEITAARFVGDTLTVNGRTYSIDAETSAIAASGRSIRVSRRCADHRGSSVDSGLYLGQSRPRRHRRHGNWWQRPGDVAKCCDCD